MNNEVVDWKYIAGLFDGEGNIGIVDYPETKTKGIRILVLSQSEGNNGENVANLIKSFLEKEGISRVHHYVYDSKDRRGYKRQPCHLLRARGSYKRRENLWIIPLNRKS